MSLDGNVWIVNVNQSEPIRRGCEGLLLQPNFCSLRAFLFSTRPILDDYQLNQTQAVETTTRDGLKILAYLTVPNRIAVADGQFSTEPVPLVAHIHGGPYARDDYGFNRSHQLFADRGHAVISTQFRGSTGFGKAFLAAATGEWGGKMHDDIIDACNWAVGAGIALQDKIAIHGGWYGDPSALVGVTFTPEYFFCAVDMVGPSNSCTLIDSIPAYWGPIKAILSMRIGAHTDPEEGRAFLLSRSPISRVDSICRPLLIGQVAKDIRVTYVLYPNEGHVFARPPNNISFTAVTEASLAKPLG
ncbi:hypothetical protein HDU98_010385 [Podochytrium sp. JEL0797]|nr:hypothetical protein HDU98_010385 [Podochytrium sp. JEL0797]